MTIRIVVKRRGPATAALQKIGERSINLGLHKAIKTSKTSAVAWPIPTRLDYFELRPRIVRRKYLMMARVIPDKRVFIRASPEQPSGYSSKCFDAGTKRSYWTSSILFDTMLLVRAGAESIVTITPSDQEYEYTFGLEFFYPTADTNTFNGYRAFRVIGTYNLLIPAASYDRWFAVTYVSPLHSFCVDVSGAVMFDSQEFRTKGYIYTGASLTDNQSNPASGDSYISHYYDNPAYYYIPVPPGVKVTVYLDTLRDNGDGWEIAWRDIGDPSPDRAGLISQDVDETISVALPVLNVNSLYRIDIDSSNANDDEASLWITTEGGSTYMYASIPYMLKRYLMDADGIGSVSVLVDAGKSVFIDLEKIEHSSRNGQIIIKVNGINILEETWTFSTLRFFFPVSSVEESYSIQVASLDSHLGPGPFVSPDPAIPIPDPSTATIDPATGQSDPSTAVPKPPELSLLTPPHTSRQGSGEWSYVKPPNEIDEMWVYEASGIKVYNLNPDSSDYGNAALMGTATDFTTGLVIPVSNGEMGFISTTDGDKQLYSSWVTKLPISAEFVIAYYVQTDLGLQVESTGFSAIIRTTVTGTLDDKDVTFAFNQDILHMRYDRYAFPSEPVWIFESTYPIYDSVKNEAIDPPFEPLSLTPDEAPLPLADDYVPLPSVASDWFFDGSVRTSAIGPVPVVDIPLPGTNPVPRWANIPLQPKTIDREAVPDNIGLINAHLSGLGSF